MNCPPRSFATPPVEIAADEIADEMVVDHAQCDGEQEGLLFSYGPFLWFDERKNDCAGPAFFEGYVPSPCEDNQWESYDLAPQNTWNDGVVLVTAVNAVYGTIIPGFARNEGIAVRSSNPVRARQGYATAGDALVAVVAPNLSERVLYSPGVPIRFLGRVGERALVIVEEAQASRIAAVGLDGTVSAWSPPFEGIGPNREVVGVDAGEPWSVALRPDRFALLCGTALCVAEVEDEQILLTRTALNGNVLLRVGDRIVLQQEDSVCREIEPARTAKWTDAPEISCDGLNHWAFPQVSKGLPVDGRVRSGIRTNLSRCLVRDEIVLPKLENDEGTIGDNEGSDMFEGNVGLLWLPMPPFYNQDDLSLELLVRGNVVALGFRFLDGMGRATVRRDFGVALGPEAVALQRVTVDGMPYYRVRVNTSLPFDTGGSCWLGRLVVRVDDRYSLDDEWAQNQAFANTYWEFGMCE